MTGAVAASDTRQVAARRYSAFISYTHADRAAVFRLHARLEGYRLPRRLAEQVGAARIKPVLIDRAEMAAAPDLADATREALADSDFLIVACTPRTPQSTWVGREIEAFRELRGRGAILAVLLEGDETTSFHRALLDDGHGHAGQPLAADFRRVGDGPHGGLLKLIAALLGLNLDDLIHRDARRQRRRTLAWSGATAAVALVIAGFGWSAYKSSAEAAQGEIVASRTMERQLDDLREQIKAGGTLDMAAAVTRNIAMFYDQQPSAGELPEVALGRAKLLQAEAEDQLNRGNLKTAEARARAALRITSDVVAREPDDTKALFLHAQSAYWVGVAAWRQGDTPLAANAFARYADLANRLVKADPADADWRLEQGYANNNLGTVALREARNPGLAWRYFSAAQDAFRDVARRKPGTMGYELSDNQAWLADTLMMEDKPLEARAHRAEQRRILAGLLLKDPTNRQYRSLEVGAETGEAVVEGSLGNRTGAIRILRETLRQATALAAEDPSNEALAGRKRAAELFLARAYLDDAAADASALGQARTLLHGCSGDWTGADSDELPVFCNLLDARLTRLAGDPAKTRQIVADPRIAAAVKRRPLTPRWHLDFPKTCQQIGDPRLCA